MHEHLLPRYGVVVPVGDVVGAELDGHAARGHNVPTGTIIDLAAFQSDQFW